MYVWQEAGEAFEKCAALVRENVTQSLASLPEELFRQPGSLLVSVGANPCSKFVLCNCVDSMEAVDRSLAKRVLDLEETQECLRKKVKLYREQVR
jgi:hypothetical protein